MNGSLWSVKITLSKIYWFLLFIVQSMMILLVRLLTAWWRQYKTGRKSPKKVTILGIWRVLAESAFLEEGQVCRANSPLVWNMIFCYWFSILYLGNGISFFRYSGPTYFDRGAASNTVLLEGVFESLRRLFMGLATLCIWEEDSWTPLFLSWLF